MCGNCQQRTIPQVIEEPIVPIMRHTPNEVNEALESGAMVECYNCNTAIMPDDGRESPDGDVWCEACHSEEFYTCEECSDVIHRDDSHSSPDGNTILCESCYDDAYSTCSGCSETFANDDLQSAPDRYNRQYCSDCYSELYGCCDGCGCECNRDNMSYNEDRGVDLCDDCYANSEEDEDRNYKAKSFARASDDPADIIGSLRTFGVELETSRCPDYCDFEGRYHFGAKDDGTITGKEFVSTVLSGDRGLKAVRDFCDAAEESDFSVDAKCGFHVHIGVSDLSDQGRRAVAVAYKLAERVWRSLVSRERRSGSHGMQYAGPVDWCWTDVADCEDFDQFCEECDRYKWLNLSALAKHSTFEVRLHSGSINADEVCFWIEAHVKFVDYFGKLTVDEVCALFDGIDDSAVFNLLSQVWDNAELSGFYLAMARKYGTNYAAELVAA